MKETTRCEWPAISPDAEQPIALHHFDEWQESHYDQGGIVAVTDGWRDGPLAAVLRGGINARAVLELLARTGVRSVAYGQPSARGDALELRYTLANADINEGDLLTTSGVDGVYPPGLPVARVASVERRAESTFTRIVCEPLARVQGALHVLVLAPVGQSLPASPLPEAQRAARRPATDTSEARSATP